MKHVKYVRDHMFSKLVRPQVQREIRKLTRKAGRGASERGY